MSSTYFEAVGVFNFNVILFNEVVIEYKLQFLYILVLVRIFVIDKISDRKKCTIFNTYYLLVLLLFVIA